MSTPGTVNIATGDGTPNAAGRVMIRAIRLPARISYQLSYLRAP